MTTTAFNTPYDWRLGTWATAQKWAPDWAASTAPASVTPQLAEAQLRASAPQPTAANYADWQRDLAYIQNAQAQTRYPTWLSTPWSGTQAQVQPVTWNPPQPPAMTWSNPGQQAAMNMREWTGGFMPSYPDLTTTANNPLAAQQQIQALGYMNQIIPWAQLQQNTYQYAQDFNEAQRRFNTEQAWAQAAQQFDQDLANRQLAYQQQRDQAEFELGRQQVWGRNQAPNVRWMRNWG